jgi:xanthine dehydrogenase YagT iron-sulfur-binding subunit
MSEEIEKQYSAYEQQPEDLTEEWLLSRRQFILASAAATLAVGLATDAFDAAPTPVTHAGPGDVSITLQVNGIKHQVTIDPRVTLLDALRERLQLTGTRKGCDQGQCGACTILVNGRRINSCLALAIQYQDAEITTIEGLPHGSQLHPVQTAFIAHDAFQCGYCTSGQIMSAVGLLHEGHARTDAEVQEAMSGNICRCGAYQNILAAIQDARPAVK